MLKNIKFILITLLLILICGNTIFARDKVVIDQVIAVVGNSIILKSDLYNHKMQYEAQGIDLGPDPFCEVLEEALYQKLLYNQAIIDTVEVSDDHVEMVLDRRIRYFVQQIGSREELEDYYGRTIAEIKDDFRDIVREQELSQAMESQITKNVRVTPSEVKRYFNNLSEDEIPVVESRIQLGQIVKIPPISEEETRDVKRRLNEFRDRILRGESFSTLAIMYSEDPGSARRGGELGFMGRGELYHDFEAVAFNLKPGEVSEVFQTQAGYHIAQKIERRGEQVNVRHLLLRPKVSPYDVKKTENNLDSIRKLILDNEMSFAQAAEKFSHDPGRINQGIMINPHTGSTWFKPDELDPNLFFALNRLEPGDVSRPMAMITDEGKEAYRLLYLKEHTEPKKANLKDNYDYIRQLALQEKKKDRIEKWIKEKTDSIYLHVIEDYKNCSFSYEWIKDHITTGGD